jgi:HEAT repeat protein
VIAFCTHCWSEIDSKADQCPQCRIDLGGDSRSYEEKLIAALAHPLPEARVRICWLIGQNRIRAVVPCLMHMAEQDPDLFVQKAAVEALGTLQDPRSDSLLHAISSSANQFLAAAANKSLNAHRSSDFPECVDSAAIGDRHRKG